MPEHTALAVRDGRLFGGFNRLANGEILMIACENLNLLCAVIGEANKILDNIQQTVFLKNALKECVKLRKLGILVAAVRRFPFHKSIFARCDCASL